MYKQNIMNGDVFMFLGISIYYWIVIITFFAVLIAELVSRKDNSDYFINEDSNDTSLSEEDKEESFFENLQTKKDDELKSEEEKYQEALYTINHKSAIIPGLGPVTPIDAVQDGEVELDQNDIPDELLNAEDAKEDEYF